MKIAHEMGIPFLNRPVFLNFEEESVLGFVRGELRCFKSHYIHVQQKSLSTRTDFFLMGSEFDRSLKLPKFVDFLPR